MLSTCDDAAGWPSSSTRIIYSLVAAADAAAAAARDMKQLDIAGIPRDKFSS